MDQTNYSIDARTTLGRATLAVRDAERSLQFYRDVLGFDVLGRDNGTLKLGAGGDELLVLETGPQLRLRPMPTTGLYHIAILLPSRPELARVLRRLIEARVQLGSADHAVSEALYLSDPDGNGLEIYRDRPRDQWRRQGPHVQMTVERLDAAGILSELPTTASAALPAGTRIGHMHLQVADIAAAEAFYHDTLGFDITATYPGALFLSAGGYHHHLGLNTWESRGAPPAPAGSVGLRRFEVVLPDGAALQQTRERLEQAGYTPRRSGSVFEVDDPWRNTVVLRRNDER